MTDKAKAIADKISDNLHVSMLTLHQRMADDYLKGVVESIERNRPYSWNRISEEVLNVEDYRGEKITKMKFTYAPPEKQRESSNFSFDLFSGGKPDGLRDDNTTRRFETRDWSDRFKRYHMTAAKAREYIDANLEIDANAEALKPIVKFLEHDMPCTCGEYGSLSPREYLERAQELLNLFKKMS